MSVTAARAERETRQIPLHVETHHQGRRSSRPTRSPPATRSPLAANITPVGNGPFGVRPRLRGLDSTRLLVLVDGERLNTARQATDRTGAEVGLISPDAISRMEIVNGAGTLLYGSDALAGTINIITNEPAFSERTRWLYGFNGFYSSNENGARGTATIGVTAPALRRAPAGRAWSASTTTRPAASTSRTRGRSSRPARSTGPTPSTTTSASPSTRFPIRSMRPIVRTERRDSELGRRGALRQRVEPRQARRAPVAARPLSAPADGRRRVPRFRAAVFLQRHLAAAQQSRPRVGALRSAGGHAVAGQPLAHGALPANRASAAEPAAGAVPGAHAGRVLPDQRDAPRHPVGDRAARLDAGRRSAGRVRAGVEPRADDRPDVLSRSQQRPAHDHDDDVDGRPGGARRSAVPRRWCFRRRCQLGPPSVAHPVRVPDASLRDVAVFAQDEWRLRPNLSLVAGLRGDFYNVTTEATPGYDVASVVAGARPAIDPATLPDPNGATYARKALTGDIGLVANTGGPRQPVRALRPQLSPSQSRGDVVCRAGHGRQHRAQRHGEAGAGQQLRRRRQVQLRARFSGGAYVFVNQYKDFVVQDLDDGDHAGGSAGAGDQLRRRPHSRPGAVGRRAGRPHARAC